MVADYSDTPLTDGFQISHRDGLESEWDNTCVTGFLDCNGYSKVDITMIAGGSTGSTIGIAFYDGDKNYISGTMRPVSQTQFCIRKTYDIPEGAAYFRSTYWNSVKRKDPGYDMPFSCKVYSTVKFMDKLKETFAEVDNIRVEMAALDELRPQIEQLGGMVDLSDTSLKDGSRVIQDGTVEEANASVTSTTAFLDCEGYDKVETSVCVLTTVPFQYLAFYDSEYRLIGSYPRIQGAANGMEIKTYDIPGNAKYLRATYWNTPNRALYGPFVLRLIKTGRLDSIEGEIKALAANVANASGADNTLRLSQMDIIELNVISPDGSHAPKEGMGCTDFIPCEGASVISYTQVRGTVGAGLAFYDSYKQFLSYVDSMDGTPGMQTRQVDVPLNACYFRTSGWDYENSKTNGVFSAELASSSICVNGKRASNGESTFFSLLYNRAPLNPAASTFEKECLPEELVCTTGVVILPPSYSMRGKPSRVILNFHGWSHYVNYKQWGAPTSYGFMQQKKRWADAGYAVIDINHKDSSQKGEYSGIGSIQDDECYRKAWEYVRDNYNVEATCFIVCGSAGGINGINACYNWAEVRAGVWLDAWVDVSRHAYPASCGKYYFGYSSYDAKKVGTRNPMTRIKEIGGKKFLSMPPCPVMLYPLQNEDTFLKPFIDVINDGGAVDGDFYIRECSGITHSNLVSGGNGDDPQSRIVDNEIINFFNQH